MLTRSPDLNLCIKQGNRWKQLGVGWTNENGNVNMVLDQNVTLPKGTKLTLFKKMTEDDED